MRNRKLWILTGVAWAVLSAQGVPMAADPVPALATAAAGTNAQAVKPAFSQAQIEQMVAPIALYPDALLAQVLMASTYPLEIVQASRWQKKNASLKGEALDKALLAETWDPSVKTLAMFPSVLERMNENLDWTQDLGDAFLAQEQDVMDTVQRLRREAQKTGALKDTPQQKVVVEKESVVIEPADPQTVYVPTYNPAQVYGTPAPETVYYPTVYQQPVQTTTTSSVDPVVAFGAGALVGGLLTAAIMWDDDDDWHGYHVWNHGPGYWNNDWNGPRYGSGDWNRWRGDTNINGDVCVGRCTTIEKNEWKKQANSFQHNPEHRGGVKYRDADRVAARHPEVTNARAGAGIDRNAARGKDKQRPATLPGAAQQRPGATTTKPADRGKLADGDRERPSASARPAERPKAKASSAERPKAEARPAQRAETPKARPEVQRAAPERSVARAPEGRPASAFQSRDSGSFERAASARGAQSRGGGMSGGGGFSGGGGRGGGGGGFSGGGGRGGGGRGR